MIRNLILLLLAVSLSACGNLPQSIFSKSEPQPASPVSRHPAVVALLDTAQRQSSHGHPDRAAATLERAVKIEPRNARLWQQLARLRLQQGKWSLAENLASKSSALATNEPDIQIQNWRLIAEARGRQGDRQGADRALARANSLENL